MSGDVEDWWTEIVRKHNDRTDAMNQAFQALEAADALSKVTVHRYICGEGCGVLGTVVRLGSDILVRTRDYKLSPGMNAERSVEQARRKNTLDGARHWPGHVFDVRDLATWGDVAGMDMNCRHVLRTILARDVLATIEGVRPGHPGKPTIL